MKRKFVFKNHAIKLKVYKHFMTQMWAFREAHLPQGGDDLFDTYEEAFKAMQKYSKYRYGEKAV